VGADAAAPGAGEEAEVSGGEDAAPTAIVQAADLDPGTLLRWFGAV
jgi:hypothetical protein